MIDSLRDRSIIAACLVLYALGMLMVTIGHSHAQNGNLAPQNTISTFSVLCSGDLQDKATQSHCPYCRLTDMAVVPIAVDLTPQIKIAFIFIERYDHPFIAHGVAKRSMPPRGPPSII